MTLQPVLVRRGLGLLILSVHSQSVAEAAGLQVGDVLIGVSGQLFSQANDLSNYLNQSDSKSIALQVLRGGQQYIFYAVLSDKKTAVEAT